MNVKAANTQAPYGRALLAIGFASLAWVASAQQPPAGRGVQPQGAMANFTGGVRSLESPDVRASRFPDGSSYVRGPRNGELCRRGRRPSHFYHRQNQPA